MHLFSFFIFSPPPHHLLNCQLLFLQISTIWKHSYKSGEWRPCINTSSGGMNTSCSLFPSLFSFFFVTFLLFTYSALLLLAWGLETHWWLVIFFYFYFPVLGGRGCLVFIVSTSKISLQSGTYTLYKYKISNHNKPLLLNFKENKL